MARQVVPLDDVSAPDPRLLRNALGRFATGIAVVTTCTAKGKREGVTVNSFSAVSLNPPLILWSIRNEASSLPAFMESGNFAVNVLAREQVGLSHHFATPRADKFDGIDHGEGLGGCPLLEETLALFECRLDRAIPAGDHQILIGRILRASHDDSAAPLLFSSGRYAVAAPLPDTDATSDLATIWEGPG